MIPQQDYERGQSDLLQRQMIHGLVRPVPRAAGPRFMSLRTRNQTYSIAGTLGVAYAGGASSGPVSRSTTQPRSSAPPKEPTLERTRSGKPPSPRESGGAPARVERRNTTSCHLDRESWELHRRGSVQRDPPRLGGTQASSPLRNSNSSTRTLQITFFRSATLAITLLLTTAMIANFNRPKLHPFRQAPPSPIRMCHVWIHCAQRLLH